jgi:hypothetical protein
LVNENPVIPLGPEIVWVVMLIAVGVLWASAAVTLWRRKDQLTAARLIAWTVLIIVVPVIGAAGWLLFGAPAARQIEEVAAR